MLLNLHTHTQTILVILSGGYFAILGLKVPRKMAKQFYTQIKILVCKCSFVIAKNLIPNNAFEFANTHTILDILSRGYHKTTIC